MARLLTIGWWLQDHDVEVFFGSFAILVLLTVKEWP